MLSSIRKCIKFDTILPYNYAGTVDNLLGTWQAQSNDDTLYIYGSNRLAVPLNHYITPNTILEFDMNVTAAGDWYALSVVNQLNEPRAIAFKLGEPINLTTGSAPTSTIIKLIPDQNIFEFPSDSCMEQLSSQELMVI